MKNAVLLVLGCLGSFALAEMPEPKGKPGTVPAASVDPLVRKVQAMIETGGTLTAESFAKSVNAPKSSTVVLIPPANAPLRGREIARRAASAYVRAGWVYQCTRCTRWHTNLAGGYAIAKDAVATAFHVMQKPATMAGDRGYPVVVRGNDEVLPLASVVASSEVGDTIVMRLAEKILRPLALSTDAQVGDDAYCLSDPRGVRGFFSHGMVNRFYPSEPKLAANPKLQRMNVSTDWAPGSSGSAVLDEYGNIIGHVARIQSLTVGGSTGKDEHSGNPVSSVMTLNEAVPARLVLDLIKQAVGDR